MPPINRHVTFIYDEHGCQARQAAHDKVHPLTQLEALVLRQCDGQTLESQVAAQLPPGTDLDQLLQSLADRHLLTATFMPYRYPSSSQRIGAEVVVYVPETGRVHLLPLEAAEIYDACDGRPVAEVAAHHGEETVWHFLEELSTRELVPRGHATRRRVLQTMAALPVILSQLVPSPAAAASTCIQETFAECNVTAQNPPVTCTTCCNQGSGASNCPTLCSTNCSSCFCLQRRGCAGGNCTVGTCSGDTFTGVARCFIGNGGDSICDFGLFNVCRKDCNAARSDAASSGATTNYRCCQNCT